MERLTKKNLPNDVTEKSSYLKYPIYDKFGVSEEAARIRLEGYFRNGF